ncbi:hypothetical protein TNCV_4953081 [Trichonephila clavipes]|nr:hypothetical protein TNCV_4953081 [Trichonephila clavipes]
MIRAAGGSLYIWSRSVTSEGIPWPKPFHASAARVVPKPASKVGDPPCAKEQDRLDAFPNRPTMSTISRTRLRLEGSLSNPNYTHP